MTETRMEKEPTGSINLEIFFKLYLKFYYLNWTDLEYNVPFIYISKIVCFIQWIFRGIVGTKDWARHDQGVTKAWARCDLGLYILNIWSQLVHALPKPWSRRFPEIILAVNHASKLRKLYVQFLSKSWFVNVCIHTKFNIF